MKEKSVQNLRQEVSSGIFVKCVGLFSRVAWLRYGRPALYLFFVCSCAQLSQIGPAGSVRHCGIDTPTGTQQTSRHLDQCEYLARLTCRPDRAAVLLSMRSQTEPFATILLWVSCADQSHRELRTHPEFEQIDVVWLDCKR